MASFCNIISAALLLLSYEILDFFCFGSIQFQEMATHLGLFLEFGDIGPLSLLLQKLDLLSEIFFIRKTLDHDLQLLVSLSLLVGES